VAPLFAQDYVYPIAVVGVLVTDASGFAACSREPVFDLHIGLQASIPD
jgi:hypothetical protein